MSDNKAVRFLQSVSDFPLTVSLGENGPDWGLSRWGGDGLRFVPPDDEGFSLRGDRWRLLYKGRRRSHRFTILGDGAFEYDCILNREPESNVITLLLEGAEKYDFLRQPDLVPDPFLKGSYAVYKKETLIGEGTGKLCHIHRPEIIDARGRRCWGELAVIGDELQITIPEQWLVDAKYPVVVDPTVGTTTVGSQYLWDSDPPEPWIDLMFEGEVPVNRFLVSEKIDGSCTGFFYTNQDDYEAGGRPVLYSDNGNKPQNRKSKQESFIDFRIGSGKPAGWRSGSFMSNGSIASGSYIWFGCFTDFFWFPRFDYGTKVYSCWWYDLGDDVPNVHPANISNWYKDFKLSMYFTYTSAQNYVRTLTQGVKLTDSRKLAANYKRTSIQTVKGTTALKSAITFIRKCLMNVSNGMGLSRFPVFSRSVSEQAGITDREDSTRSINRKCEETAAATDVVKLSQGFFRCLADSLTGTDNTSFPVLFVRSISEMQSVTETFQQLGAFIRGLMDISGSIAETEHGAEYYRNQKDTVQTDGTVFRGLLLFVRIITQVFFRDYLLHRFLKAREEIVLKSPICREIFLDSRID